MVERGHFRILREIERQGSLTGAAKTLHLTQSALSHKIRKLEDQVGTSLWTKEGRHLKLTQAGEYLLREATRLLPQLERVDEVLGQYARDERGTLHIGMECHPCYQWLIRVVRPFLAQCPGVDVDVKQQFQFGGIAALFHHDIDILVTPDPVVKEGLVFEPVFPYEQVLVVSSSNKLSRLSHVEPEHLSGQTLYTYPIPIDRLDIYRQFLLPAHCHPKRHKTLEATEMILQMVAANRGVTTLPQWLVQEYMQAMPLTAVRLGVQGIHKQIHLGQRAGTIEDGYLKQFVDLAKKG